MPSSKTLKGYTTTKAQGRENKVKGRDNEGVQIDKSKFWIFFNKIGYPLAKLSQRVRKHKHTT